ncbi:MAG: hypothetical protein EAZ89_06180 [Bacteroidetes bacterium]|nr:MAG: hypothetical protein EAZ89_06180 [Bacteroidota bacterium]
MLKEQFQHAYDSIKPINLIKSTIQEAAASQDIKDDILSAAASLTSAFLTRKLLGNSNQHPLRKLLGTALIFGLTQLVIKNPGTVVSMAKRLFRMIQRRREIDREV